MPRRVLIALALLSSTAAPGRAEGPRGPGLDGSAPHSHLRTSHRRVATPATLPHAPGVRVRHAEHAVRLLEEGKPAPRVRERIEREIAALQRRLRTLDNRPKHRTKTALADAHAELLRLDRALLAQVDALLRACDQRTLRAQNRQ